LARWCWVAGIQDRIGGRGGRCQPWDEDDDAAGPDDDDAAGPDDDDAAGSWMIPMMMMLT
jgi:hypothetical protein